MKKNLFSKILLVFLLIIFSCLFIKGKDKKNHTPVFYKTIFWDRGKGLDDSNFPVFRHLDVSCDSNVDLDEEKQRKLICGNQYDLNGIHCLASVSGSIDSPDFFKKNSPVLNGTSYELTVDWQEFK